MRNPTNTNSVTPSFTLSSASTPVAPATGRRDLFGTMGAMLLLTAAEAGSAKAAELDQELLTCCEAGRRLKSDAGALVAGISSPGPIWDQHEALVDEYCAFFERAAEIPARTPEGLQAKAWIVLAQQDIDDGLALEVACSLARDVLGRVSA